MSQSASGTNYYELLEVPHDAQSSEINKAYHRAKQTYSQDNPALYSMFSPEEARELLRLIDEAYQVLSNPASRKAYDDSLKGTGAPPPAPRTQPTASKSAQSPSRSPSPAVGSSQATVGDTYTVRPPQGGAPKSAASSSTGSGRTQHSNFKVDEKFESEISDAMDFDGGFLQRIRVYKNISVEKMSEATRISRSYLTALENNDFKSLPAAVFVRGFVVQVARQLSLDEKKVADSYMKGFKAGGGK